ncbi:MAG: ROK family protein [Spirochaetaceae bacterium]|jgi:predicted NBD/HSP70 family sugar kinase|nr:ROK family protein [Spirochaetaceae bacterium]
MIYGYTIPIMEIEALTYLGIDLGGTKLLIGEMDSAGRIISHRRYRSGFLDQSNALKVIEESLEDYLRTGRVQERPLRAMGLGLIGRVNNEQGVWYQIDSRRTGELRIAESLSRKFALPCYVENDVRSALKAELLFGCGQDSKDFLYINVGTGIAAGIVSGGRVLRGGHYNAGEVGHTRVGIDPGLDIPCECGRINCVEAVASGSGLDKCARALMDRYPGSILSLPKEGVPVDVKEIFEKSGRDPLCALLVDTASRAIANLIMNLVRTSDPELVALGGGVVSDRFLLPRIQAALDPHTMRFVTRGVAITRLDPAFAGLLGACTVAMNRDFSKGEGLC